MQRLIQQLLFETMAGNKALAPLESLTGLALVWDEAGPAIRSERELGGCTIRVSADAPG